MPSPNDLLRQAVRLAYENVREDGGRPFGAVLARGDEIIATAVNETAQTGDPTAHAELVALRDAGRQLGTPDLSGCTVYASGQPCPMCLAAMYLAGIEDVAYAYTQEDGDPYGLSTQDVYDELAKPAGERRLPVRHEPVRARAEGEPDLYAFWHEETSTKDA